ncbi:phosphatidylinositol-3,5-bisphosphate 5-phosphatase [Lecanora helva]
MEDIPDSASSQLPAANKNDALAEKIGEKGVRNIHKFWLYETARRFYVVGGDVLEQKFRLLKLDRAADISDLCIAEDNVVYTKKDMNQLLDTLDDGNKTSGGMKLRYSFWGLLGFVKFTGAYYMLLITKRSQVAVIGGHYIYQVDGTELVPLTVSSYRPKVEKDPEEARFIGILNNLDLTRSFYFSYSYDTTRTLQRNLLRERQNLHHGKNPVLSKDFNSMFVWNHHFLGPASAVLDTVYDWCLPIIHGFVDQVRQCFILFLEVYIDATLRHVTEVSNYGKKIYITLIARRSRFFAGARFLKRGANDLGYVANDVETEQIVSEMLTTSFHGPGPEFFANCNYTSYVQHRGSIPLYWTQDSSGVSPKPDIECKLDVSPPTNSVDIPNEDVIDTLDSIAEHVMSSTGFFRNGSGRACNLGIQHGIARTNCIDCLDRTNAAQFVIGKRALSHQLHALGAIDDTSIDFDTHAINLFTAIHGNTIAVQYGGSHLVNTMETYRKINQWSSHRRDMVESVKRYYNNSFLDKQRQEAYNLFLGNYIFAQGQPMLWDLSTDYYLHHADPRAWFARKRRSYQQWFTPENLSDLRQLGVTRPQGILASKPIQFFDEWWAEYYRPHQLSDYTKVLSYKMDEREKKIRGDDKKSPFRIKDEDERDSPIKPRTQKSVTVAECITREQQERPAPLARSERPKAHYPASKSWPPAMDKANPVLGKVTKEKKASTEKLAANQWTLDQIVASSLNPAVSQTEAHEYQRYVNHPLNLPLVVSTDTPPNANADLLSYVTNISVTAVTSMHSLEDDLADHIEFLHIGEEPLTVTEADAAKKRYKAYRQWVKGKSLFKQRVDA